MDIEINLLRKRSAWSPVKLIMKKMRYESWSIYLKSALLPFALICLVVWSTSSQANIRAPQKLQQTPASHLTSNVTGLIVSKESLLFTCPLPVPECIMQPCRVTAHYFIKSLTTQRLQFRFVVSQSVQKVEALPAGNSEIKISYLQPLSYQEYGLGYLSKSKYIHSLAYELWPLKEWQLAPDFRMSIELTLEYDPGLLAKLFSSIQSATLLGQSKKSTNLQQIAVKMRQKSDRQSYKVDFKHNFPDSLRILIGEKKRLDTGNYKNFNN